ncbi:cytochrome bc1 complex diheme cytochrome c subunit [Salinibacterium hongtaonis]|uniref:Cytochrome bc1 complex cytochrome c subunit n=1 Tax=Homoserinimonas hongtaonis TaxID=2079791 RepID=A0A2U1SY78_9MICO|nr:cytochrome c [Salinibacterium hongtaonis]AWB89138.1 cystathionine beta-lyase [Salinibacterium hongtaonis]PWB96585.1 cytochrome c [Salinibacterium hongtaonis]
MGIDSTKPNGRRTQVGRRHPLASVALILAGLVATGGAYALFTSTATAETASSEVVHQQLVDEGEALFAANCSSCHGMNGEGTEEGVSLFGVGAAAVDFQVGTGRMPMAAQGPQAEKKPVQFSDEQILALATYVADFAPGPEIPNEELLDGSDADLANGGVLFRINCAMCHNVAGAGGALTEGKFAPSLQGVSSKHIYEAMVTGPQNMPVFNDLNLTPEDKADVIAYLKFLEETPSVGGFTLGSLGPVSEGLFIWIFGLGAVVGVTVWIAARAN